MIIIVNEKEYPLEYTFNSFKYMEDFDVSELATLDKKPFKIITIAGQMLFGALNHNPKKTVQYDVVDAYLENEMENGDISKLVEDLSTMLEESNFFKSLQKKSQPKKKK